MNPPLRILFLEANPNEYLTVQRHLETHGLAAHLHRVTGLTELRAALQGGGWDLVLAQYPLPDLDFEAVRLALEPAPEPLPVLLLCAPAHEARAVQELDRGAWDYILQDHLLRLGPALKRAAKANARRQGLPRAEALRRETEAASRTGAERPGADPPQETRCRALFEHGVEGILLWALDGSELDVNAALARMHGYDRPDELEALWRERRAVPASVSAALERLRATTGDQSLVFQVDHARQDGSSLPLSVTARRVVLNGKEYLLAFHHDLTEQKRSEHLQALSAEVLRILNDSQALPDATQRILATIQRETGLQAVGIRLRQGHDFPYAASSGFSRGFLQAENHLAVRTLEGEFCLDERGQIRLECTCGLVLSGQTDPANPGFTPGGSAWTNDARPVLELPAEQDPRLHPRNRCIHEGFQSVALVPIRVDREIIGLLQLNDRRKGCFSPESIRFFEGLASSFGLALQRLKEEVALRHSEQRFRSLVDSSPVAMGLVAPDDTILFLNRRFTQLFGYSAQEVPNLAAWWPLAYPDEAYRSQAREAWSAATARLVRSLDTGSAREWLITCKDGTQRTVQISSIALAEGILASFIDITERQQRQEMDRLQLQVLQQLATGAPLSAVLTSIVDLVEFGRQDWRGSIMLVDESGTRLHCEAAPRLPQFFVQALDGVAIKPTAGSCGAAVATKRMVAIEDIATHDNWARLRPLALQAGLRACWSLPILSAEGQVLGALAVYHSQPCLPKDEEIRSIEKVRQLASIAIGQRQAEASLRRSEAELEAAQALAHLGSWHLDLEPYRLTWSAETCRIFARSGPPLTHAEFLACIHPEDRASLDKAWQTALQGVPFDLEHRILAGGQIKWVRQLAVLEKDPRGRAVQCIGTVLDVTKLREVEEALRQAQKLEGIGQLAGGVAHDFNNILAAIEMQLSLLEMHPALDEETRLGLADVHTEARRAATLTRQLLMFSRRSVLTVKPLDLDEVIENLLKMLRRLIGEDVRLTFVGKRSLPPIEADAGLLEQVLMNLVVNARDAMPRGGRIDITTNAVRFEPRDCALNPNRRQGLFVSLAVSDTGCGMDESTLHRIFEPFFTTKELGKGTGLGLATVHGIAAQHKGWVEVESTVGQGSSFRVFLPALAQPLAPPQTGATPQLPLHRGREVILVVEDEPNVRRTVSKALQVLGYRVHQAENGRQAMVLWQRFGAEIDLLLTDMVMPEGMTGLDLAERLQGLKPALKVLISSGYSSEVVQAGGIKRPGVWYLPKPYEVNTLAATLRSCLEHP